MINEIDEQEEKRKKRRAKAKDNYAKNKERYRAYAKKGYWKNREKISAKSKAKYRENPQLKLAYNKIWHQKLVNKLYINDKMLKSINGQHYEKKYSFYMDFLHHLWTLSCKEEVYYLFTVLIQTKSLTKKQREILVMLREGHNLLELAALSNRKQSTLTHSINGKPVHREDGEIRYHGGAVKKLYYPCINFSAKDSDLQLLIQDLKNNKDDLYLGKKVYA